MDCARFFGRVALAAMLLAMAHAPSALATQVLARALPDLTSDAGLVVEGTVAQQRAFWNQDHTRILTEVEIDVELAHKGNAPARVTVLQMGGTVDGVKMTVHGATQWQSGERVLVFLESSVADRYRIAGFSQGKFSLRTDPATGETVALRPILGLETSTADANANELRMPLGKLLERATLKSTPANSEVH